MGGRGESARGGRGLGTGLNLFYGEERELGCWWQKDEGKKFL